MTHWTGPHKPRIGRWKRWRLITFDATVGLTVILRPKGEDSHEDVFVWSTELNGEEIDAGPAVTLPEAQQAAMDAMEGYAVRLAEAVRSLTLTIKPPEFQDP